MNDPISCRHCGANFWPETGHSCPLSRSGNVTARVGTYTAPPPATDLDLAPVMRTQANYWQAKYFHALKELDNANKGIRRLNEGRRRLWNANVDLRAELEALRGSPQTTPEGTT